MYQRKPNWPVDHSGEVQTRFASIERVLMLPMLISGLAMPEIWPEAVRVMVAQASASFAWAQRSTRLWPFCAWIASSS